MLCEWKLVNTLDDALQALNGHDYMIIAGGTDVMVRNRAGGIKDCDILDIHGLKSSLSDIALSEYKSQPVLKIGAMATHDKITVNRLIREYVPILSLASGSVGSPQIRRRGTIGGNICNASPAADTMPVLAALNASVCLKSMAGVRVMLLSEFVTGPGKTCREKNELLCYFYVPIDTKGYEYKYTKIGKRNSMAISISSCAWIYSGKKLRIAYGASSATPKRASNLELLWDRRREVNREDIANALRLDITPIDDMRASGEYRFAMAEEIACDLFKI